MLIYCLFIYSMFDSISIVSLHGINNSADCVMLIENKTKFHCTILYYCVVYNAFMFICIIKLYFFYIKINSLIVITFNGIR